MDIAAHGRILSRSITAAALVALACLSTAIGAEPWRPEKAVELIVPTGPGGGNDSTVRIVQQLLQRQGIVKVPLAVVNRPGGGQAVAYSYLVQRAGDGHYLGSATLNLLTNRITGTNPLSYRDLTPVVQLTRYYLALAVKSDSPIKSAADLAERLREKPGSVSFASAGGAYASITIGLMGTAVGIGPAKLRTVVFKSGGEAMAALLGGHVDVVAASPSGILPHVTSGAARVVGVTAPHRLGAAFADVPTLLEQGLNVVSANWYNLVGPPGLSPAQIAYWEDVFEKLTASSEWKKEVERNIWEDSFLKSRELLRSLQEQEKQIYEVLNSMKLTKK